MDDHPLQRRLVLLMIWRLVIITLLLGSAAAIELGGAAAARPGPLYALIAWTYGLSACYAVGLRLRRGAGWLAETQLALDALTAGAFVWMTGGAASYFSFLFVLPILAASVLRSKPGVLRVTALSMLLYAGTVAVQYAGGAVQPWSVWAPDGPVALPQGLVAQYTVAVHLVGLLAVGLLGGSLAERIRRADERLAVASAAMADLKAYSDDIIESLAMGLVTTDAEGRVLTFNRAAEAITGHARASAPGLAAAGVLALPPDFTASLAGGIAAGATRRADYKYRKADGTLIDIGLSATMLQTPRGPAGFLYTFQDVTTIRRLEREARVQQRLAAVGEMAAGIAHEIRNPLASISGSMQVLRSELGLTGEQAQLMDIVLQESERLNQTITSFLAYARPQRFAITRVDLRSAVEDTALLLRNSVEAGAAHAVEVDVPSSPVWCEADEGQLRQVVWNLATNGLRAMPDGGRLRLGVRAEPGGASAVLEVRDEGVGIPETELDAVFQPFHSTFERGSGLGMAVVHRIVSDYGGEVRVTSQPGAGTTVEVRIPARALAAA
ncbi:MAG TPA: ATP-binding protein [Vicinamibacterales bacterium]|nr:ATP-binding protein [Vicinamibacterales bacterium]